MEAAPQGIEPWWTWRGCILYGEASTTPIDQMKDIPVGKTIITLSARIVKAKNVLGDKHAQRQFPMGLLERGTRQQVIARSSVLRTSCATGGVGFLIPVACIANANQENVEACWIHHDLRIILLCWFK
jgi:hypothetical protein